MRGTRVVSRAAAWRSLLYVPGSSDKMLAKSRSVRADMLVYDLEDSVARHRKQAARSMVAEALSSAPPGGPTLGVRINAPSSEPDLARADVDAVLRSERVESLVLPKVESARDLALVASAASPSVPLSLVLSVESASSLLRMPTILEHASLGPHVRVAALLFASEDYCAATGVQRTRDLRSLLYPRAQMATIAKAYGLQAIDMVCIEYKDDAYLREECRDGASLGFDGKQAIHPAQLDAIHAAYSPSKEDVDMARAVLDAYRQGAREGRGAVGLAHHGKEIMIDAPMLLQAQRTLERAGITP
ncbi:citrate lyase subunit beta-like protein [Malassezia restricta]|uniref:citrate lyase subunit beta-like protein n=1 Tax=Malassezia restricta TaxID=76775 RepID=UPI000DD13900|nr:citrate lyase subunit beta-like protein [Malassezia restricta]AXA49857.1 citrate lyase subunit beta-like protein [Malassezia restricta]